MNSDKDSILLELLEVLFNSILYLREIYPSDIFIKRSYYRLPLFISIFPPLNDYIESILKVIQELQSFNQLQKVELVIYQENDSVLESYVFDVLHFNIPEEDSYLIEFEEQARLSFQLLERRCKSLKELPKNSKFKICLQTTDASFIKICNDSQYQDFLWLQDLKERKFDSKLIPIATTQNYGIDFFIETIMSIKEVAEEV